MQYTVQQSPHLSQQYISQIPGGKMMILQAKPIPELHSNISISLEVQTLESTS